MCKCKNVVPGSYEVAIPVWYDNRKRVVGIDHCIVLEILELWKREIITIESCCGHNKVTGYIAVDECCIDKMIKLGYKQHTDKLDCFYPLKL